MNTNKKTHQMYFAKTQKVNLAFILPDFYKIRVPRKNNWMFIN